MQKEPITGKRNPSEDWHQKSGKSNRTEDWHQKQLIQWARQYEWSQYLYHIANETTGGVSWVTRNRQMGCRKGVPDLCLPIPMHGYHGLYIELKTERGRMSEQQKRWLSALNQMGYKAECCKGWEEARDLLVEYMEVKDADQKTNRLGPEEDS